VIPLIAKSKAFIRIIDRTHSGPVVESTLLESPARFPAFVCTGLLSLFSTTTVSNFVSTHFLDGKVSDSPIDARTRN
jgi:hypothetical protein